MKCYQNFSMFDEKYITPIPMMDNITDEMKPIAEKIQKTQKRQNFDIILNKYFNDQELTDIQLQQLSEHHKITMDIIKTKNQEKKKRPDQYQKLFYKKAFKYAQASFFKKNKKNKSRRMSQFYHYHFDKVATSYGIPLINFYHPDKKTKPGLKTGQKSFNLAYIKLILKSKSFQGICKQFHSNFLKQCGRQRNNKIKSFVSNLANLIQKNRDNIGKTIQFLQSSKCKIPWTNKDINEAWLRAFQDLSQEPDQNNTKKIIEYQKYQKIQNLMHLEQPYSHKKQSFYDEIQYLNPISFESKQQKEYSNEKNFKNQESFQFEDEVQQKLEHEFQMMQC